MSIDKEKTTEIDRDRFVFNLKDMSDCWNESRLSFAKEIGNDMSDLEADEPIYKSFKDYLEGFFRMKEKQMSKK